MDDGERDDLMELVFRILFAALRAECDALREVPQPEPETGYPGRLKDAMDIEGVPERYQRWVETVATRLERFADSVRIAERNNRKLGLSVPRERRRPNRDR